MKIGFEKNTTMAVKIRVILGVIIDNGLMFVVLFITTGRWDYWQGWLYFLLWVYFDLGHRAIIPSELIQERNQLGTAGTKKWDYVFYGIYTPLGFIVPLIAALDGGLYHWTDNFPLWVNALGFVVIFLGYSLMIFSLWKNRFFSVTVRIQKERGHYVIDRGPYAFIRHPGYVGFITSFFATGFALNSLWALVPAGLLAITLVIRTYLEDMTLQRELPGYTDYAARVRYRLVPGIW